MTVLRFPKVIDGERGPRPIFVCAPSFSDMLYADRKVGLGYSREEARTRFYEGGSGQGIETRVFTLTTAPRWLKFHLVSQFGLFDVAGQPLSPIDQETREKLGTDPYRYGKGPRKPKRST